ncbi:MAG TPA: glycoside hydrolase family 3 N-terminal domain-containing protein [Rubrobacteraceae bacterium]|nr:glycoside hydrolase family 3 N-terminal domain-containing protein [Rubrobacteraceae bacterium]
MEGAGSTVRSGWVFALLLLTALVGCSATSERSPGGAADNGERTGEAVRAESLSVRDAVGQMFVVAMGGTEPDYYVEKMIRERNIGGVILFAHNMESEAQARALVESLQELSLETEPSIPLFVAVDQEGGKIGSAPWVTPQPAAARIGARGDASEARAVSEQIGRELLRAGVNTDLAPVVDTGFGAAIGPRSYGEDPELVARLGAAAVEGFEAAGVVSAAKHFPNHGPATADSHESLPVVDHDLATVRSVDLPPFEAAVEAGVPMVMTGHLLYPAIDPEKPASLSGKAMRMLREEVGFDGVVVTDDLAMTAATGGEPPARAAVEAVKAGADLLLISSPPQQQADAYDSVVAAVESGEIPRGQIRASVERVLRVKGDYPLYRAQ